MNCNSTNQEIRLTAGELTPNELLAVRACMRVIRNAAFDEAADIAEDYAVGGNNIYETREAIATAIHALKDTK
jgi:hypothetical protein